ncbi:MAG: septum formation initiator family protein [Desulfobulbaceae bacterium]|nr:septum formation initiator family protein [Desulfobulbaceae bacterium]
MLYPLTPRERKRFWSFGAMVVLLLALWLLLSPKGVLRYYALRQELGKVQGEAAELDRRNKELVREIVRLKTDPGHLEEVARHDYGLIKKNEMVFEFPQRPKKH